MRVYTSISEWKHESKKEKMKKVEKVNKKINK